MSFLPGLKTIWNDLKVIIAVILIVLILVVAWEAILIWSAEVGVEGFIAYEWMGAYAVEFRAVAMFAKASPWVFAALSFLTVAAVSPETARAVLDAVEHLVTEIVDFVLDLTNKVLEPVKKSLMGLLLALGGVFILTNSSSPQAKGGGKK